MGYNFDYLQNKHEVNNYTLIYKQQFYKQRHTEIGKNLSKS